MEATTDRIESKTRSGLRVSQLAIAFGISVLAAFVLGAALVFGLSRQFDGKVLPGVHVGKVDLSGLTAADARAKLATDYASLGEGQITVETPDGNAVITYKEIGRGPDVDKMVDEAMAAGRANDPIGTAVGTLQTVTRGVDLPVIVKVDTNALATKLRAMSTAHGLSPVDAKVDTSGTAFAAVPAKEGKALDEMPVATEILQAIGSPAANPAVAIDGHFVSIPPQIADHQAQDAVAVAGRMVGDVTLTAGSNKFTIDAATVRKAIGFGLLSDKTYGPVVNVDTIKPAIEAFRSKVDVKPVDPTFLMGKDGKPAGITKGVDGSTLNVDSTAQAVSDYLNARAKGSAGGNVALVMDTLKPKMSDDDASKALKEMVMVNFATIPFDPGEANCNGVNIRLPAARINGTVIQPGQIFSFWQAVGPVDQAHGFCQGGVIKDGKSDHTGAIGGGICSASTASFNAAMGAGFEILERHAHYYYISRYPAGLDATVFMDGSTTWDMRWRNDTDNPVLVVGKSTYNTVTFEIWTVPTGRKVTLNNIYKTNPVPAKDTKQYTTSLKPGQQYRSEYPTDGFNITRTRTVTNASGAVIHQDTWTSIYAKVDGVLQIGVAPSAPPASPSPTNPPASPTAPASAGLLIVPFLPFLPLIPALRRPKRRR